MFIDIKDVIYEKKMMPSSTEYFHIEICEDRNILEYSDNKNMGTIKNNVDNELVMQYFDRLFRIMDGWKNVYQNNNFIDGIEWYLQITYKNGEIKQYFGKNKFPANFEYLDKIKYEIIDEMWENKI